MVGEKLGSYKIEGTLGVGAMGVVYKARHETTGRAAAVKVINKDVAQRGKTFERFQREAEILKQFRHSNIVRFLALGRYQGTSYIAMEFIPGRTLEQVLNERGPLPWKLVVELGIQMCSALHYAHEHGVVHRDLKPSNLMVTDSGAVKLTDFGIAKDLDKTALTATGRTLGTAAYMAPEQIRGTPEVSHKTDLYALGVVLYQMLTGRPPFEGASPVVLMHCHMNERAPRPSAKVAEIPRALDDLVVQLMAKAPPDRPWDAAAAGQVLETIREKAGRGETVAMVWPTADGAGDLPPTRSTDAVKKPRKSGRSKGPADSEAGRKRRRLETAGLVAALFAIGGLIAYLVWPPGREPLFQQAEKLMASDDRHKWDEALKDYIEPLDARFPDNPYKPQTKAWRDKIALADAEARAHVLESPVNTRLNEPKNKIEERFIEYFTVASAARKRGDDPAAAEAWASLAQLYNPDDPEERPWQVLAKNKSEELHKTIAQRRTMVTELLTKAMAAEASGQVREARGIRAEVISRYGQYTDLADLLGLRPATPPGQPAPEPEPPATPEPPPAAQDQTLTTPDTAPRPSA
jgi:serine/threonine-protein kinase